MSLNPAREAAQQAAAKIRSYWISNGEPSVSEQAGIISAEFAPLLEKARELCAVVGTIGSAGEIGRVKAELLALLGEEK